MATRGIDASDNQDAALPWPEWFARGLRVAGARKSVGFRDDAHFARYVAEAHAAGLVVFAYHAILGHQYYDPVRQAQDFLENMPAEVAFLVLDDEAPGVSADDVVTFVSYCEARIGKMALVLYGNWNLAAHIAARPDLRRFGIWWAGYPTSPLPTTDPPWPRPRNVPAGLQVIAWQYAGENGVLPPYGSAIDLSVWYELPVDATVAPVPPPIGETPMKSGTLYGIHAEGTSQAVPLMKKFQAAGVQIAALLAHENPGLCTDAKRINPAILTIARWHNPSDEFEGGGGSDLWPPQKQQEFATKAIQLIFDRTNDTEYAASDYFCPGLNEWDKPGVDGWRNMAQSWVALCKEAKRRSPEMEAKGLHPIRLAIPGTNNGTPEWAEMVAVKETGLFELMKQRGDIFILHEGVWWDEPIDHGHGDLIPGAPSVPANAGSKCGRFNYWYGLLGVQVPFVITEMYDGLKRTHDPALRLERLKWYDRMARRNPWCRGFCPFELTDIQDGPWWLVDFTPTFQSAAMLADMVAEKDKPNPTESDDMPTISDADFAVLLDANTKASAVLAKYRAANWWDAWASGLITPSRKLKIPPAPIQVYRGDGSPLAGITRQNAMDAFERQGAMLRVTDAPVQGVIWWVRAADVQPA